MKLEIVRAMGNLDLMSPRLLDGAFATELDRRGVSTYGPLWSARAIFGAPEAVVAVHRSYLEAGADILLTGTYQASALGFLKLGFGPGEARVRAEGALRAGVALALRARAEFGGASIAGRAILIGVSLGPYGGALANGAEYTGAYGLCSPEEELILLEGFHTARVEAVAGSGADFLAFETVPKLLEARAIASALRRRPGFAAWVSFTCRDGASTAYGDPVQECAAFLDGCEEVEAVGVNCVAPALVLPLLGQLRAGTGKPLVAYPNSGEGWDAAARSWTGPDAGNWEELARSWLGAGANVVGGCCRTGPGQVRAAAAALGGIRQMP